MSSLVPYHWVNGTHISFGVGAAEAMKKYIHKGARVVCLHTDDIVEKNGSKADIDRVLTDIGASHYWRGGIEPNPDYSTCCEIIKELRKDPVDFIVPVGGGSVMDAAKFISSCVNIDPSIDPWDTLVDNTLIHDPVPSIAVCTLAATGSEWNERYVISRRSTQEKRPGNCSKLFFKCSILDPRYTLTVPSHFTANGLYDSFCHVMEQYATAHFAPMQDKLSEGVAKTIIDVAPKLMNDLSNLEHRATAMQTSAFALNTILQHGTMSCWGTHRIGMSLTAKYDMDHAETLVVIQPALWRHMFEQKKFKLAHMAETLWGYEGAGTVEDRAKYTIMRTEQFSKELGFKLRISDYAKSEKNPVSAVDWMTESTWDLMGHKGFGEGGMIHKQDVKEILSAAF